MVADKLIKNAIYLDPDYIPERLQFREEQISAIKNRYLAIHNHAYELGKQLKTGRVKGSPANDAILIGPSGTGKTAIIRYSMGKISDLLSRSPTRLKCIYISGMGIEKERTFWINMCKDLNLYFSSVWSTDQLIEVVKKEAHKQYILVFLDEMDTFLEAYEGTEQVARRPLYWLSRLPSLTIVAALNNQAYRSLLPEKTRSSWQPDVLTCQRYVFRELQGICKDRVKYGLHDGVITDEQIDMIANQAYRAGRGDARKLIRMLRMAVDAAKKRDADKISDEDVEYATRQLEDMISVKSITSRAHDTHAVLISLLAKNPKSLKSSKIIKEYESLLKMIGQEPLAYRTVIDIIGDLRNEGLVNMERARVRGNVYNYSYNERYMRRESLLKHLAKACDKCKATLEKMKIKYD